ncbi:MAG: TonB-dependent receptor [Gammaproteobacteria bacterium]|nr:TonB-dependent receptor [Gammaproteobacteria bacterium]MDH5651456.1 TonB-dependent receptor [Gammaproteobacteria bacterium]
MKLSPIGLLVSAVLLGSIPNIHAEEQSPVVVTATRTAQTIDSSLASVTVITREDIENASADGILELLRNSVGINVSRSGGTGKSSSFYLRGTESDHVLVMIDGVRASSATLGTFGWENLALNQIEKIEIVKGPRASLYGSDAIGGVIQIFTRKTRNLHADLTAGTENTQSLNIGIGGGKDWQYSLTAGVYETDGIPALESTTEDNGYDRQYATFNLTGKLGQSTTLTTTSSYSDGTNELDAATGNIRYTQGTSSIKLTNKTTTDWTQSFNLGYALDRSTSYSPFNPSNIITRRYSAGWQHDITFNRNMLTLGLDQWQDNATKDNSGIIDRNITTSAAYTQYQMDFESNDIIIGARVDEHEIFGQHETWQMAWGHDFDKSFRFVLSHGTAFKSPTVNDLYWPNSSDVFGGTTYISEGNENLKPETSRTTELSLRKTYQGGNSSINLFSTKTDDMIDWVTTQTGPVEFTSRPTNINSASIQGAELQVNIKKENWLVSASMTYLDAINNATNKQLDRRPQSSLGLTAKYTNGSHIFQTELTMQGKRTDRDGSVNLEAYTVVNLVYQYNINKQWRIKGTVENLFDEEYVMASGFLGNYNTYGLRSFLSITYNGI